MTRILKRVGIFLFILVCVFFNNVYAEKNNNVAAQENLLKKFSAVNPKDRGIKYRLGGFYTKVGKYREAATLYETLMLSGDRSEHVKKSYAFAMYKLDPNGPFENPYEESTIVPSQIAAQKNANVTQNITGKLHKANKSKLVKIAERVPTEEEMMYDYLKQKKYVQADKLLAQLLIEKPNDLKFLRLRTDIALELKDYNRAVIYLEDLKKRDVNRFEFKNKDYKVLSYAYSQIGDIPSTVKVLEELYYFEPTNLELIDSIIGYSMEIKDWDKAFKYVNKGLEFEPNSETLLRAKGDLFSIKKDYDSAVSQYFQLVQIYPKDEYKITLSNLYMAVNNFECALATIEPLYLLGNRDKDVVNIYLDVLLVLQKTSEAYKVAKDNCLLNTPVGYRVQGDIEYQYKRYKLAKSLYCKALKAEPKNRVLKLKVADSLRSQKKYYDAESIYKSILSEDCKDIQATMGLGYLELDRKRYPKSRDNFNKVLSIDPCNVEAQKGIVYTYTSNLDRMQALKELRKIPKDDEVTLARSKTYFDMEMFSDAQNTLRGSVGNDAYLLSDKILAERALTVDTNYYFLNQQLAETYKLNINKIGVLTSKYVANNINVFTDYNMYIYSSGRFQDIVYNNVTNEVRLGAYGRPVEKVAFRGDIGVKVFQDAGAMLNTDSWIKYYFNDKFNLKLGFKRNNIEQSYLSAVGLRVDGVYTGQAADNRVYLEFDARHPYQFYTFGRVGYGVIPAQNLLTNQYVEGMVGAGRMMYYNEENKYIRDVLIDLVSYNSHYNFNLLNIYDTANFLFGGYWSPQYFSADTFNLKLEGDIKNLKLKYGLKGFIGTQYSIRPSQFKPTWGASVYLAKIMNDYLTFKLEYNYFNYADVQRNQAMFHMIMRGFRHAKH